MGITIKPGPDDGPMTLRRARYKGIWWIMESREVPMAMGKAPGDHHSLTTFGDGDLLVFECWADAMRYMRNNKIKGCWISCHEWRDGRLH